MQYKKRDKSKLLKKPPASEVLNAASKSVFIRDKGFFMQKKAASSFSAGNYDYYSTVYRRCHYNYCSIVHYIGMVWANTSSTAPVKVLPDL
jgi:hypothetical protein